MIVGRGGCLRSQRPSGDKVCLGQSHQCVIWIDFCGLKRFYRGTDRFLLLFFFFFF